MIRLPQAYLARMETQLGSDYPRYLEAMEQPARRALRVNSLKVSPAEFCRLADFVLTPTGTADDSFCFADDVHIGKHPLHAAGLCYVQEPSAQLPATLLGIRPGMRALDLCAAPGGKSTQIAALLQNTGLLVSNEPVRARADVLAGNLARMGAANALVTCMRPDALATALGAAFDAVIVDAPCSGEGMFRKDADAVNEWSLSHVEACAARQRLILESAARLVRAGGTLVYATCTFSREENEDNVEAFLLAHPDFSLETQRRVHPQDGLGEGQFMARLVRAGESAPSFFPAPRTTRLPAWETFFRETFTRPDPPPVLSLPDGRVLLPPAVVPPELGQLRVVRAGVLAGEIMRGRFEPDHALALAYPKEAFRRTIEPPADALRRFMGGETIACDPQLSGWCTVTAFGHPIGWGKAVGGVLKNHIPKGLRLR